MRLTTRCWQKHGKHAWHRTQCLPARTDSKSCRFHCRPKNNRIVTSRAVAEHPTNVAEELPELIDQRMSWRGRSIGCGDVNESHIGQRVTVCGWVHRHRGLGGVVFCDIRDSSGLLQVFVRFLAVSARLCLSAAAQMSAGCQSALVPCSSLYGKD